MVTKKRKNKIKMDIDLGDCKTAKCMPKSGCPGAGYFLGFVGAAVYYVSTATGFWNGILGVLKALVWPAFLIYEALKFLGM